MVTALSSVVAVVSIAAMLVCVAQAQSDVQEWLDTHNAARRAVAGANIPDLVWSDAAYNYALSYAQQESGQCLPLTHSGGSYGENLAWTSDTTETASWAVNAWVGEAPNYDYGSNSCVGGECGHYTQVVWAASTGVGCASVECTGADGGKLFVCSYDPPGNFIGQRPYTLP